jgi:hypothetical protein
MKTQLFARQGDVGLVKCRIPKAAAKVKLRPLALGEVTGHSHRVAVEDTAGVEMYEIPAERGVRTYMRITAEGAVAIIHEEHGVVKLPAGWQGEVVIAREYDEEVDFRSVVD